MKIDELDKFLEAHETFNNFYIEIINLEIEELSEEKLDEALSLFDIRNHELFKDAHEVLEDMLATDDIEPLKNGDILIYEGEFDNTVTNTKWGEIYEAFKIENQIVSNAVSGILAKDKEILRISPDRALGHSGYVHYADLDNVEVADFVKFLDRTYIVTEKRYSKTKKNSFSFSAREVLKSGKLSKNKYIRVSNDADGIPGTISRQTYQNLPKTVPEAVTEKLKKFLGKPEKKETRNKPSNRP